MTTPFLLYSLIGANTDECYGEYTSGKTGKASRFCFLRDWKCPVYKSKLFSIRFLNNPTAIKEELYKNGPVNTGFIVYEDFL